MSPFQCRNCGGFVVGTRKRAPCLGGRSCRYKREASLIEIITTDPLHALDLVSDLRPTLAEVANG